MTTKTEELLELSANIDDMPGELLAVLPQICLSVGALDAWLTPIIMKKGRPGHMITALCDVEHAKAVEHAIFTHSTTLGVRRTTCQRVSAHRTWRVVETPYGEIKMKVATLDGKVINKAPEFEDCLAAHNKTGAPLKEIYGAANHAYEKTKDDDEK